MEDGIRLLQDRLARPHIRLGEVALGSEDSAEALTVQLAQGKVDRKSVSAGPASGTSVGQHRHGKGAARVDGQVLGLQLIAGWQVQNPGLERQLQGFEQDVDAGQEPGVM
jgi:hypothetical protein